MSEPIVTSSSNTLVLSKEDILALQREKPKMPQIAQPVDLASAIRAIGQIKEVLETRNGNRGSKLDAGVTWRDMLGNGLAQVNLNGTSYAARPDPGGGNVQPVGPQNDVTIPPAPTGLRLMGAITNVIVAWDRPGFRNFGYTEVWRSATDNLGEAVMIAQTPAFVYADSIGSGTGFFYWIRHVSTANIAGPFNRQAGTYGHTGYDASYLLDVLAANPPEGVNYNPLLYVQDNPNLVIDGQPIPVGVYMNTAYIRALSVTNAMIANLAVDNAKIANLDAVKITAGDIDADRMRANIVEAAVGRFNTLSALSASLGQVQIDSNGWLRSAGVASYYVGNGIWMGYDNGLYKFRLGNPAAGHSLSWDGSQLNITGNVYSTGDGTFRGTFYAGGYTGFMQVPTGQGGAYIGQDGMSTGIISPVSGDPALPAYFALASAQRDAQLYAETLTVRGRNWGFDSNGHGFCYNLTINNFLGVNGDGNFNGNLRANTIGTLGNNITVSSNTYDPMAAPTFFFTFSTTNVCHKLFYTRARHEMGKSAVGRLAVTTYQIGNNAALYGLTPGPRHEDGQDGVLFVMDYGSAVDSPGIVQRFNPGTYVVTFSVVLTENFPGPAEMIVHMRDIP